MKHLYRLLLLSCMALCGSGALAQDIHLSQFYETPILRNPALIGIFNGDVRVQAVYRNQWNQVTIPYQTGTLSGEIKFPVGNANDYLTTGLQMTYDRAGTSRLQSTQIMPAINYHKSLNADKASFLSLGFMGGFVQRQFDPANMTFDNQYTGGRFDPSMATGEEGKLALRGYSYLDAGVGLSYNSVIREDVNYYIGVGYFHFNSPKVSFYNDKSIMLNPKITFNAGISIPLEERVKLVAEYNQLHQGSYSEYIGGAMLRYALMDQGLESTRGIYGGLFLRWNDALIPTVKLDMDKYELGMSYDANISQLRTASQSFGGFEISLVFKGFLNSRNSTLESVNCPRF
ncbi:type IX secretion system membrane protein, PorP/SprF family [Chitinophaga jiangningensis]|uniref:Type IX secretion system membrane protein, PorP/SprF family n=1 Tax=Chitinophaga jiangningensis TaxID=1419482 RepID=A0A1M6VYV1_9BACT|nr:PorP/SprF family type IX secretion system membrane protein [Chitinophaga jiangningensis]SHK86495.1 type IX secretion system membrane protein, PorP/SprF family [Chitinophaga jiangningensis]